MKLNKLILFVFSMLLLGVLSVVVYGDRLAEMSRLVFKVFVRADEVMQFPQQGYAAGKVVMKNYNPNYNIEYSTNGGKNYRDYSNQNIHSFQFHDLSKFITSIRYKHPFGEQPSIQSFLVKAKHRKKDFYLKPQQLTFWDNYHSELPLVSLIIDEGDLFSTFDGMMTLGSNAWYDEGFYQKFWDRNANYKQRKGKWNKKTYFQYFERDTLRSQLICTGAISGNATRSFEQKSIKLKVNRAYSKKKFDYPYFGKKGLKKYTSLVLRNSGNDNKKTLFADLLMQSLAIKGKLLTQRGKPVNVFINGNYWGIYNLRERYDSFFIAKKEKVEEFEITLLEGAVGELKSGDENIQQQYIAFVDSIFHLKKINDETVEIIGSKISLKSFKNYIFNETFFGNGDWLKNNAMWYKAKDKKWRWLLNDLDYGLAYTGSDNVKKNYFDILNQSTTITAKLYQTLMKNEGFRKEFIKKMKKNTAKFFRDQRVEKTFASVKDLLEPNMQWHTNRWRGNFTLDQWEANCTKNLDFLLNRKDIYLNQIESLKSKNKQ